MCDGEDRRKKARLSRLTDHQILQGLAREGSHDQALPNQGVPNNETRNNETIRNDETFDNETLNNKTVLNNETVYINKTLNNKTPNNEILNNETPSNKPLDKETVCNDESVNIKTVANNETNQTSEQTLPSDDSRAKGNNGLLSNMEAGNDGIVFNVETGTKDLACNDITDDKERTDNGITNDHVITNSNVTNDKKLVCEVETISKEAEVVPQEDSRVAECKKKVCKWCGGVAKYRCPACDVQSCSLACVTAHKRSTGCDGKRRMEQIKYVSRSKMDDELLCSDYRLLERAKDALSGCQQNRALQFSGSYRQHLDQLQARPHHVNFYRQVTQKKDKKNIVFTSI